jgi:hypothetical protein
MGTRVVPGCAVPAAGLAAPMAAVSAPPTVATLPITGSPAMARSPVAGMAPEDCPVAVRSVGRATSVRS